MTFGGIGPVCLKPIGMLTLFSRVMGLPHLDAKRLVIVLESNNALAVTENPSYVIGSIALDAFLGATASFQAVNLQRICSALPS